VDGQLALNEFATIDPALLRFGVLCAGTSAVTAAQLLTIRKLLDVGETEFALLVILPDVSAPREQQNSDLRSEFASVPLVSCLTTRDDAGYRYLPAAEAQFVGEHRPDLLLDFTGATLGGEVLEIPAHGVWTFSHDVDIQASLSSVTLVQLRNPPGSATPLASCIVGALPVSPKMQRRTAMAAAADLPAGVCKDLLRGRADALSAPAQPNLFAPAPAPLWRRILSALALGRDWVASQLNAVLFVETWNVGIVNAPIHRFLEPGFRPAITWVAPVGRNKFIADPFAIASGNEIDLFVEEFDQDRYQGYIGSTRWTPGCQPDWKLRIDEGVHMSYPYPVQHGGKLYVVPESSLSREVALYECESASGRWRKVATLIKDFAAVDSTLIQHGGGWWLFCTCRDDFPDSKLYLWFAPDLFGPWQPHRMNPVKCDVRSSRPGGTPFVHDGALYRPAQDSSKSYGGALTINRITSLSQDEFREEPRVHLEPFRDSPYPDGLHTLSAAGSITVLDGKRMAFLPRLSFRRLRHKLGRVARILFRRGAIR